MTKPTKRQIEALEAVLAGQRPHWRRGERTSGARYWYPQTNMGGAGRRMVEAMQEAGLLSTSEKIGRPGQPGYEYRNGDELTALGLRALEEHYLGSAWRPDREEVLARVAELLPARERLEAEREAQRKAAREAGRQRLAVIMAAERARKVEQFRAILAELDTTGTSAMDDDQLLALLTRIVDVEMGVA